MKSSIAPDASSRFRTRSPDSVNQTMTKATKSTMKSQHTRISQYTLHQRSPSLDDKPAQELPPKRSPGHPPVQSKTHGTLGQLARRKARKRITNGARRKTRTFSKTAKHSRPTS